MMDALEHPTGLPAGVKLRRMGVREFARRLARHGEVNLDERGEPTRFEGNRRARRKAAAEARKGVVVMPPVFYPASPDAMRVVRGQPEVRQA